MTIEVLVQNAQYWLVRGDRLLSLLRQHPVPNPINDPAGETADDDDSLILVDPEYWASQPRQLLDALSVASQETGQRGGDKVLPPVGKSEKLETERLTLTVEEAAALLGISRAFAYESVRRGDIPHIKIGRRILVPKAKLEEMLASTPMSDDPGEGSES